MFAAAAAALAMTKECQLGIGILCSNLAMLKIVPTERVQQTFQL